MYIYIYRLIHIYIYMCVCVYICKSNFMKNMEVSTTGPFPKSSKLLAQFSIAKKNMLTWGPDVF